MPSVFVVHNPNSGRAELAQVHRRFDGRSDVTVRDTNSAEHAASLAAQAVGEGFDVVVAAGGDGTVNSVANGIWKASADVVMGVLPLGTANDFAQTLGVPDDLEQACKLLFSMTSRPIDLVELQTETQRRCLANVASGGNSDRVTEALTDELKQTWGPLCYLRGAIGVLADLESYEVTVAFDDEPAFQTSLWNIIVANGRTNAGHLLVAPRANPEDGLLDVILIRDGSLGDIASLAAQFALSDYLESEQVVYRQARSFTLESNPRIRFSIDGEAMDEQPVAFRAKPSAVRMITGAAYTAEPLLENGLADF